MLKTVYLAGLISTDYSESISWREVAECRLQDHFEVLTPMRGKSQAKLLHGGLTDPELTAQDIVYRDFHDVIQSDVILAHLENFGSPRPLTGTIAELAWAWDRQVPVVAVAYKTNALMYNHPFIKEFVSHYFTTLEDATDFINHYYGD